MEAADSHTAYHQMTDREREQYDALIKRLDEMIAQRRVSRDRRQTSVAIDFTDRRVGERRKS